jgi:hypothetical protein
MARTPKTVNDTMGGQRLVATDEAEDQSLRGCGISKRAHVLQGSLICVPVYS